MVGVIDTSNIHELETFQNEELACTTSDLNNWAWIHQRGRVSLWRTNQNHYAPFHCQTNIISPLSHTLTHHWHAYTHTNEKQDRPLISNQVKAIPILKKQSWSLIVFQNPVSESGMPSGKCEVKLNRITLQTRNMFISLLREGAGHFLPDQFKQIECSHRNMKIWNKLRLRMSVVPHTAKYSYLTVSVNICHKRTQT